jgi:hypothetical protein
MTAMCFDHTLAVRHPLADLEALTSLNNNLLTSCLTFIVLRRYNYTFSYPEFKEKRGQNKKGFFVDS